MSPCSTHPARQVFFAAGLIARFPLAMITLGIVIMLSHAQGDYELPSLVASTCILSNALIAPQLSRLADTHGQTRVALPAIFLATAAFCLLIAAFRLGWSSWTWFTSAIGIGLMPNFGAFSRTRWSRLYTGTALLRSAFALESLREEMVWMTGPIIVVWCTTHLAPEAGVAAAAMLFVIGALMFCVQRRTEPQPITPSARPLSKPALFSLVVLLPCVTLFAFGGFFGVLEVVSAAFAKQMDVPEKTFYPLTAYAVGSFITGSAYGLLHWTLPLRWQLLLVCAAFALATLPFFFIGAISTLTVICFIAGAACSPSIIIALRLVESLVNKGQLTESMTWALVSPFTGMAAGFALAGKLVDAWGAAQAFYGTVLFGCVALVTVVMAQPFLYRDVANPPAAPEHHHD